MYFFALVMIGGTLLLSAVLATAAERRPIDQLFDQVDKNHDGYLSEAEWHEFMQQRFEAIDANHDGAISRTELEAARQIMRERLQSLPLRDRAGHLFFN